MRMDLRWTNHNTLGVNWIEMEDRDNNVERILDESSAHSDEDEHEEDDDEDDNVEENVEEDTTNTEIIQTTTFARLVEETVLERDTPLRRPISEEPVPIPHRRPSSSKPVRKKCLLQINISS